MKDVDFSLMVTCRCGQEIKGSSRIKQHVDSLAEEKITCIICGTKYFIHIQEVAK